ncbi:MAG: hypothetical protein Q9220_004360 [cf. Caloplaca sp. 1 TL-2023]
MTDLFFAVTSHLFYAPLWASAEKPRTLPNDLISNTSNPSADFNPKDQVQPLPGVESNAFKRLDTRAPFNLSSDDRKNSIPKVGEKDGVLSIENRPDAPPQPSAIQSKDSSEEPGSAYVVIPALSAGNACTQLARYTSQTFTFGPGELSTIEGPANITKEFNFADLPCPPPNVASAAIWFYNPAFDPKQTYAPVVAPFPQIYDLNPAFSSCTVALNQGFDPGIAIPEVEAPTLPGPAPVHLGPTRRDRSLLHPRDGPVNAHFVPLLPQQTQSPENE